MLSRYTITLPPGTWSVYPVATFQPLFKGVAPTIEFASGDGTVWQVNFGNDNKNTVFNFTFIGM